MFFTHFVYSRGIVINSFKFTVWRPILSSSCADGREGAGTTDIPRILEA